MYYLGFLKTQKLNNLKIITQVVIKYLYIFPTLPKTFGHCIYLMTKFPTLLVTYTYIYIEGYRNSGKRVVYQTKHNIILCVIKIISCLILQIIVLYFSSTLPFEGPNKQRTRRKATTWANRTLFLPGWLRCTSMTILGSRVSSARYVYYEGCPSCTGLSLRLNSCRLLQNTKTFLKKSQQHSFKYNISYNIN